jgi:transcriptional regulator with XRE-family HTH domain
MCGSSTKKRTRYPLTVDTMPISGEKLRRFRLRCGATQAEFGSVLGATQSTVSGWEKGRRPVQSPPSAVPAKPVSCRSAIPSGGIAAARAEIHKTCLFDDRAASHATADQIDTAGLRRKPARPLHVPLASAQPLFALGKGARTARPWGST